MWSSRLYNGGRQWSVVGSGRHLHPTAAGQCTLRGRLLHVQECMPVENSCCVATVHAWHPLLAPPRLRRDLSPILSQNGAPYPTCDPAGPSCVAETGMAVREVTRRVDGGAESSMCFQVWERERGHAKKEKGIDKNLKPANLPTYRFHGI